MSQTKQPYKSDRTERRKPHPGAVAIKTLCTGCKEPLTCHWPPMMEFDEGMIPAAEYMAHTMRREDIGAYCDDCIERMPDVKLEDLRYE